jgi:hypothetical protein
MVQALAEQMVSDLDIKWSSFLISKVNTFTKWDLVRFFHDNPHTKDTAENIASFLARDVADVRRELDELVAVALLDSKTPKNETIYQLSKKKDNRLIISEFINACHNREFRIQAIHMVISSKSRLHTS